MPRRTLLVSLLLGLHACMLGCTDGEGDGPIVVAPAGDVVRTFGFDVEIQLPSEGYDPWSLFARLNGSLVLLSGGPTTFTARIEPGAPLRDQNVLTVSVRQRSDANRIEVQKSFLYLPPKARARRITRAADLIEGPLAHGRVGDWLLENSVARFVVQDVGQRDLYSVGQFGGNLIDAELVGRPGLDSFLEIQPMLNVETVINAQTVEVVNDGQNGLPAVLRTCGPDDLLDFVNPSSQVIDAGLPYPPEADDNDQDVQGCTEYTLEPLESWVKLDTEIFNDEAADLPLVVGDWLNAGGELDVFGRPAGGVGPALAARLGALSFYGYGRARGVDYALTTTPDVGETWYVSISGVTVVLHHADPLALLGGVPPFVVPAGGSAHTVRYFGVGDGSSAHAVDLENEVKGNPSGTLEGIVRVGGVPAAGAQVSLIEKTMAGGLGDHVTTFTTDDQGRYSGSVPIPAAGQLYAAAAGKPGVPYEGGGTTPVLHDLLFDTPGQAQVLDFDLPATGQVEVDVSDGAGPLPARITVVGFDPSPRVVSPGPSLPGFGSGDLGLLFDPNDRHPFGVVAVAYADATGKVTFDVEPGDYQIFVSRGSEYSRWEAPLQVSAGQTTQVDATIVRVLDTSGFVSSDFHVHGVHSADSRVSHRDRVLGYAAEGVDNLVMTDHHVHTDLDPVIDEMGLGAFLASTVGEEITTFDYGHFNAYPLAVDESRPSRGSTDWAGEAPPGEDFPMPLMGVPAYNLTPPEIAALATTGPQSLPATTIQVNHINSHFDPLQIDTGVWPVADGLDATERLQRRLDPAAGNLFHPFPALEVWNGASRGHQSEFLDGRIGVWMNLLNWGYPSTAIADTDSHRFASLRSAGATTWTAASALSDTPASLDSAEVAASVAAGRAVGGQGVFVLARLLATDGSNDAADLTATGKTSMTDAAGDVTLEIRVQAPLWAQYDTIEIYANAATTKRSGAPYQYLATPDVVLTKGSTNTGSEFVVSQVVVDGAIPGASRLETLRAVDFTGLLEDTWFVVVVKGTDDESEPLFPSYAMSNEDQTAPLNPTLGDLLDGNLGEPFVTALGFTNPLYFVPAGMPAP